MSNVINLGFITIHLYSVCILIGVFVGYNLILRESKRLGFDKEVISDLIFYMLIFGIIGARVYYCIFNMDYYSDFLSIFKIWEGGLAIHGGIIFGLVSIYFFCKKKGLSFIYVLDIVVVGLIIAQAIGRWGNFFNGEAHGGIVSYSFLKELHLPSFIIKGMYINGKYYMPTFLLESIWCLIGFIIMVLIRHKGFMKKGYLTGFYLIWYGIERFFVEGFRTDSLMLFSIKMAQVVSLFMVIIGTFLLIYSYKKNDFYGGV